MAVYRSKVRLSLSQAEASSLAGMVGAVADDADEILDGQREVTAFQRAYDKLRVALQAARDRDAAKEGRRDA